MTASKYDMDKDITCVALGYDEDDEIGTSVAEQLYQNSKVVIIGGGCQGMAALHAALLNHAYDPPLLESNATSNVHRFPHVCLSEQVLQPVRDVDLASRVTLFSKIPPSATATVKKRCKRKRKHR